MKVYILIVSVLFVLSSCKSESTETNKELGGQEVENIEGKTGDHQEFFENGEVKMEGTLMRGDRIGTWTSYYENGQKQSENEYQTGVRTGKTISYYKNGLKRYVGFYKNGKRTGSWLFFTHEPMNQ